MYCQALASQFVNQHCRDRSARFWKSTGCDSPEGDIRLLEELSVWFLREEVQASRTQCVVLQYPRIIVNVSWSVQDPLTTDQDNRVAFS